MKKINLLIIFLCYTAIVFGQPILAPNKHNKALITKTPTHVIITLPDILQIKNISNKPNNRPLWENNMPWLIALLIGLLSFIGNLWTSFILRHSNENIIETSKETALKQIEAEKDTSLRQINANIALNNRQEWINELRHLLSEFLTYSMFLTSKNSKENQSKYVEKFVFAKVKIELLTNLDKPEQQVLLKTIESFLELVLKEPEPYELPEVYQKEEDEKISNARIQIVIAARELFTIHWEKIKESLK